MLQPVVRRGARGAPKKPRPVVTDSSATIAFSGSSAPSAAAMPVGRERARWAARGGRGCWTSARRSAWRRPRRPAPRARRSSPRRSPRAGDLAAVGREHARLVRDRRRRPPAALAPTSTSWRTSFSTASALSTGYGRRSIGTRPAPRCDAGVGVLGDERAPVFAAMRPASSSAVPRSAAPPSMSMAGSPERSALAQPLDARPCRPARARPPAAPAPDAVGLVPRGVGGHDQRRDLAGRRCARPRWRRRRRRATARALGRRAHPVRHRPRDALDVRGERRVVLEVIGRVLADDVDDAGAALLRVVQVGEPVAEPGAQVQQRARPACRSCGSSRRPRRSPRLRTGRARSACRRPCRARRRSASPTCRGW